MFAFQQEPDKYSGMIKQVMGEEKGNQFIEEQKKKLAENGPIKLDSEKRDDWNTCPDLRDKSRKPQEERGDEPTALQREMAQKLIDQFQKTLDSDPNFKQARDRYLQTAEAVADKGVFIVLAAGNNGDVPDAFGLKIDKRSGYNLYAQSDHVITVGGYDAASSAPKMFEASSAGTEQYPITVLGPGQNVPSRLILEGKIEGTSYSAPLTAATIGLMLEQNPNLKFDDVKRILQAHSDKIPGIDSLWQGAGMLRMDDAIIAARDSRTR